MKFSELDEQYMKRTLLLAGKGSGSVSPNPMVGSVIVRGGKIVAEGWHQYFGGPHAEVLAVQKVKKPSLLRGATLYVNLEPCSHFGKTPPCAPMIAQSGIARVVIGMKDPHKKVNGRGIRQLQSCGVEVAVGCLADACRALNSVFLTNVRYQRPYVGVKTAMSLDGKCATRGGESKWITSPKARRYAKKLRAVYDAILVGKNTVLTDNPELAAGRKEPVRIVLDSRLEIPLSSKVFRNQHAIVAITGKAAKAKISVLENRGITVKKFTKKISLPILLSWLFRRRNICSVFVEGGPETVGSFFDSRLVDYAYFFISPKIIGGRDALPAVTARGIRKLHDVSMIDTPAYQKIGPDFLIHGRIYSSNR